MYVVWIGFSLPSPSFSPFIAHTSPSLFCLNQVFVLDPVRGHELWPTHLEESSFLLIADYTKAQEALLTAAAAAGKEEGGEKAKMWMLKFTVAEALGHPLAAPSDGTCYEKDLIFTLFSRGSFVCV